MYGEPMSNRKFQVLLADTQESLRLHYVVRYRVFCLETGYEDAREFPDKMERDDYDKQSVHFLVRARETGQWVAAMRLVLGPAHTLPLAERCAIEADAGVPPDAMAAEISRLCVVGSYRRRRQEHASPHVIPWDKRERDVAKGKGVYRLERRGDPEILLRLINAAVEYGHTHQINYGYALMAQSLMRILKSIGLNIVPIGPVCEHRGIRRPYLMNLETLFADINLQDNDFQEMLFKGAAYQRYSEWQTSIHRTPSIEEVTYKRG